MGVKQIGMLQKSEHCLLVVSTQSRKTWQVGKVSGQLNGNLCRYSTGNRLDSPLKMDILLVLIPIQHVQQLSLRISFGMLFRTLGRSPGERSHSNSWNEHTDEILKVYCFTLVRTLQSVYTLLIQWLYSLHTHSTKTSSIYERESRTLHQKTLIKRQCHASALNMG